MINNLKIAIGADHAGYEYKKIIIEFLKNRSAEVENFGTDSGESVDYPDFAHPVAQSVQDKKADFGILICGSGNGVAITANKHEGIRAALCWTKEISELARQHNNANILCIPARFVSIEVAKDMVYEFLNTDFLGGKHLARIEKI